MEVLVCTGVARKTLCLPLKDVRPRVPSARTGGVGQMRNLNSVGDRCEPTGRRRDRANPKIPEGRTDANSQVLAGTGADAIFRLWPGLILAALHW